MKVNEKIPYYRKRAGLSQEELGKRLLVSRQTVSLWETGQTLPTLDNLTRLREIFGVSIDELLEEDGTPMPEEAEAPEQIPREQYTFAYTQQELKGIYRSSCTPFAVLFFFFLLCLIATVISVIVEKGVGLAQGVLLGVTLMMVVYLGRILGVLLSDYRRKKAECDRIDYTLEVFDDRFVRAMRRDGVLHTVRTVAFSELTAEKRGAGMLGLCAKDGIYHFPCHTIREDSILYSAAPKPGERAEAEKLPPPTRLRIASTALFVLSILGLVAFPAVAVAFLLLPKEISWLLFAFLACLFVASAVLGLLLRRRGGKGKGAIALAVIGLILYTSMAVTVINFSPYDPIGDAEAFFGIDIPDAYRGMQMSVVEDTVEGGYVFYRAEYYFDSAAVIAMERAMQSEPLWLTRAEAEGLLALCPDAALYEGADYFAFYNYYSEQYNTSLAEDAEPAGFLAVIYFDEENMLMITEYETKGSEIQTGDVLRAEFKKTLCASLAFCELRTDMG